MSDFAATYLYGNTIKFQSSKLGWEEIDDVMKRLHQLTFVNGFDNIIIDLGNLKWIYPNGIIPLITKVDILRRNGVKVSVMPPCDLETRGYAERLGWLHYLEPTKFGLADYYGASQSFCVNVFRDDTELNECVNKAIEICLKQLVFAEGVPQAFEWALNELAGNVLVHSGVGVGWLQVQINRAKHQLMIALCDPGVGIPYQMKRSFPEITSDRIAIEKAIEKGVTSNPEYGQGNGLAGTVAIAQASKSYLAITSGKGRIEVSDGLVKSVRQFPPIQGTFVEMQFNTQAVIDLSSTLWGREPVGYIEMQYEDQEGELAFTLKEHASNFGNRPTGEKIRILILNLLKQNRGKKVLIDMSGVEIMASSFADELFGKLVVEIGIIDFWRHIGIIKLNSMCKSIIEVAVQQRIVQNYGAHNITLVKDYE